MRTFPTKPPKLCKPLDLTPRRFGMRALSRATDEILADHARREARVLVTLDLGFANIRNYPPDQHAGIVVLRPTKQDKATVLSLLRRVFPVLQERSRVGELWIAQRDRIRFAARRNLAGLRVLSVCTHARRRALQAKMPKLLKQRPKVSRAR
jgi:predicted nuclease of predicted toxin-antitoxin system